MSKSVEQLLKNDVILDACSAISLYATGQFEAILQLISGKVYIASYVVNREIRQLFNPNTNAYDIPIDLSSVRQLSLLHVVSPQTDDENDDAVTFAKAMATQKPGKNMGEAITGAIAKSRKWTMMTDDKDATTFFTQTSYSLDVLSTLHTLEYWARSQNISPGDTRIVLLNVRNYARYVPPRTHPLNSWWESFNISR